MRKQMFVRVSCYSSDSMPYRCIPVGKHSISSNEDTFTLESSNDSGVEALEALSLRCPADEAVTL